MSGGRSRVRLEALAVFVVTFVGLLATEPFLAITWDEGYTLGREARMRWWFQAFADPPGFAARWRPPELELVQPDRPPQPPPRADEIDTRAELFAPKTLAWFWPFAREEPHGHPPMYALIGMIGDVVASGVSTLTRARIGVTLTYSLAGTFLYVFFRRRYGLASALAATAAWCLQPNLFALAHYATYDALLTSFWVGTVLAFAKAARIAEPSDEAEPIKASPAWGAVVLFGLLLGAAANTKFTGWLIPLPFLVWCGLYRSRRGILTLTIGGVIAILTAWALNPAFWPNPIDGVTRFVRSNLTRGETIPIPVLYLGRIYKTPIESLPWSNTLVWTVLVTPVGFLTLALIGLGATLRRIGSERFGVLVAGHWAFLLLLRAMPHTPGHDGVRLFVPAFGLLAVMTGLGAATLGTRWRRWAVGAAVLEGVVGIALVLPVPLSYFSPLVGGLPGATKLGMEPTYAWDGLTPDALRWLNERTRSGERVAFATFPTSWLYLKRSGALTATLAPLDPGRDAWYVVQNRPGAFGPLERALAERGRPAFEVRKFGVPLVRIYPFSEVEACRRTLPPPRM